MIGQALIFLGAIVLATAKVPKGRSDPICSQLEFKDQLLASNEDCNKFIQCSNGDAVTHSCAAGLHFNFERQVCDHPGYANCKQNVPASLDADDETKAKISYLKAAKTKCKTEDSEGLLLPHQRCNKFYKCNYGKPVTQNCPAGLNYDEALNICEWAASVNCGDRRTGASKVIMDEAEEVPDANAIN